MSVQDSTELSTDPISIEEAFDSITESIDTLQDKVNLGIEQLAKEAFALGYKAAIHHDGVEPSTQEWLQAKLELGL